MDDELRGRVQALKSLHRSFASSNRWGVFDASSLIVGFDAYIDYNGNDASWVANIADSFRRAGGTGALSTLPDAAIAASLKAAGLWGMRQSVTFDDPIAYGFPPTTGYADDPVNTASGNFIELENDLPFGALVSGLRFTRTYNSRSDRIGAFGPRWASWAEARLRARPEGAEYEGPDGRRAVIPRMGTGYGRLAGIEGLVEPTDTGLRLRWFGGGSWEFDQAGLPVRTERGPGTEIRFRHEDGRLVEMSHEGGKRVTLQWSAERIVALSSSDGRRVDYRYDDGGNLVEAAAAAGARRYEVDEAGRIVRVIDADGVVEVDNTYDEDGRVKEQVSRFGRRALFHYLPGRVTVNEDENGDVTNTYIHDHAGRMIGIVDGHGGKLSRCFDDWGNLVTVTERNGATTLREWDDRSRLVREVRPGGSSFAFAYDDSDRVLEVTCSTGAVTTYRYEGDERSPAEMVDPEGGVTRLVVEGGLVHSITDPDGVEIRFEFDADGNIVSTIDAEGNRATVERDGMGRPIAAITPTGRRTEFSYDAASKLVERRDPGGAVWRFDYSDAGRLTGVTDPLGARREIRFGEHGDPSETVDELGQVTSLSYDPFGNLATVVAPDGAKWEMTYDALSRLSAVHDPAGGTWLREYDVAGALKAAVDPAGTRYEVVVDAAGRPTGFGDGVAQASFDLDELGRPVARRSGDGSETKNTYDLCGRLTSSTDALGAITRYGYTRAGRLSKVVAPSGRTTTFEYDRCGRLTARVDPGGRRWTAQYDAGGAVLQATRPGGRRDWLSYDETGRVARRTRSGEGTTSYSYDPAGRVTSISAPRTGTRRFSYDAAGRLEQVTDANRGVTRYTYNERGWVTQTVDPLGGRTTRRYDEVGRAVADVDQLGRVTSYSYDPAGRLIERVDGAGVVNRWTYDVSGRVASVASRGDDQTTVERDAVGRVRAISELGVRHELSWDANGRLIRRARDEQVLAWRYDSDGNRAAFIYPDGSETTYEYDAAGDLTSLQHPAVGTLSLERDGGGRTVTLSGEGFGARWTHEEGRVVGYHLDLGATTNSSRLERDEAGRVIAITRGDVTRTFDYDESGQLTRTVGPEGESTFTYDANGRLIEERSGDQTVAYLYDAAGQPIERRGPSGVTRFGYDGAGRRVSEVGPEVSRSFGWDAFGSVQQVEVTDADGTRATSVVVDALGELAGVGDTTLMSDSADPLSPVCEVGGRPVVSAGAPWAIAEGGKPVGSGPDPTGTLGSVDAWGASGSSSSVPTIGYRGEVSFEGLVWLRNRVYDPATRGFLSRDPLPPVVGAPWAGNPYSYAGNDPIGSSDPLGMSPVTEAELASYRETMNRSLWERAGDLVQDNWEVIVGGAMIIAGAALIATGVGGPVGVLMIGGALSTSGFSMVSQKLTKGEVDWGQVAVAGAVGAIGGAAGAAAAGGGTVAKAVGTGYLIGAGSNVTVQTTTGDVDWNQALVAGGIGAVSGLVGGYVQNLNSVAAVSSRYIAAGQPGARLLPYVAGGGAAGLTEGTLQETADAIKGDPFEIDKVGAYTFAGGVFGGASGMAPAWSDFTTGAVSASATRLSTATAAYGGVWTESAMDAWERGAPLPPMFPMPAVP